MENADQSTHAQSSQSLRDERRPERVLALSHALCLGRRRRAVLVRGGASAGSSSVYYDTQRQNNILAGGGGGAKARARANLFKRLMVVCCVLQVCLKYM